MGNQEKLALTIQKEIIQFKTYAHRSVDNLFECWDIR